MNLPVIAFFNNKGGVGKTSLVYHLAWMYADLGISVVVADLDPQANLTAACLPDDHLEDLFESHADDTVFGCIRPLLDGTGDISQPKPITVSENLFLLAGDLSLSGFEDELSHQWAQCLDRKPRVFRVLSAFWSLMPMAQEVNKPIFHLKPADGAIGAHTTAVNGCYRDFEKLAMTILDQANIATPWLEEKHG